MHHGENYNSTCIHICLAGNYETQIPPKEQIDSAKELIQYLYNLIPTIENVIGHKDVANTACPGKNVPLDDFKKIKRKNGDTMLDELIKEHGYDTVKDAFEKLIKSTNADGKPADWAKDELKEAVDLKITDGSNPEMFATRQEVAIMCKRCLQKMADK